MDRAKFKQPNDIGFVRRQRSFQADDEAKYKLQGKTLQIGEWKSSPALTASVISRDSSCPPLKFIVSALEKGVFRLVFEDLEPARHKRHVPERVLTDEVKPLPLSDEMLSTRDQEAEFGLEGSETRLQIHYDPFRVDVIQVKEERVTMSVNGESRLRVEAFDLKDGPQSSETDDQGRWEETFNNFTDPKPRGPESVGVDIALPFAKTVHGIPERTMSLALSDTIGPEGKTSDPYRLYNLDVPYYEMAMRMGLYGCVPLLMGRDGESTAAMFWHNTSETYVDVASETNDNGKTAHWYSESGRLDVLLLPGPTIRDVFRQYMWLTGAPTMPQHFALGYHQCRYSYMNDEDARNVNAGFGKHDIPYDVLWLDIHHTDGKRYFTWDKERFPDPSGLQQHLMSFGRKLVTIIDPHIKADRAYSIHKDASKGKLYVTEPNSEGKAYIGKCWPGDASYLDFTNAKTREFWASRFDAKHYPHFTDALHVWNDMNEPSVFGGPEGTMAKHILHVGDVEHRHVHNVYGHDMVNATHAGLLAARNESERPFVLTRSFFAGSQRYSAVWTGDNVADWAHLAATVPMMLALQLCGIVNSGADVGGFGGNPDGELFARWYQVGAFQPFFRGHSCTGTNRREPWNFAEPYTSVVARAIRERYRLLPLWYTLFAAVVRGKQSGFEDRMVAPPMRPVWWEFPGAKDDDVGWMVGDCLLVAPVLRKGVTDHSIELPEGAIWYDLFDENRPGVAMPRVQQLTLQASLERMFIMQRGGTIVPRLDKPRRSSSEMRADAYTLSVALDETSGAKGRLYIDDGRSYRFLGGEFLLIEFVYEDDVLSAKRVAGDGVGAETSTVVSNITVLGFGNARPKSVIVEDREVGFQVDTAAGVLSINEFSAGEDGAEWSLRIARH